MKHRHIGMQHVVTQVVAEQVTETHPTFQPLTKPDRSKMGIFTRMWNAFCDWLDALMQGVVRDETAHVRGELEEGYIEIAEHADAMRKKYPDAYAAADKELRKRYFHLD